MEHLFVCLRIMYTVPFMQSLFKSFSYICIGLFLLLICTYSLYIVHMNVQVLLRPMNCKYFLSVCDLPFLQCLLKSRHFKFCLSSVYLLFSIVGAVVFLLKKSLSIPKYQRYYSILSSIWFIDELFVYDSFWIKFYT